MIIRTKPRSGLAIRNAFRYAAQEMLGDKYERSHELREGVCVDFTADAEKPTQSQLTGESVRIRNGRNRTVRITLVPLDDEKEYSEFCIVAEDGHRAAGFNEFRDFQSELLTLAKEINRRFGLWVSEKDAA